jgi:hypothetical protein
MNTRDAISTIFKLWDFYQARFLGHQHCICPRCDPACELASMDSGT